MGTVDQKKFSVTVTSKGQMTIPADVRDALGIVAGDRLEMVLSDNGGMNLVKKTRSYKDIFGSLAHLAKNRVVPIGDEVNHAMAEAMHEQDIRSKGFQRKSSR
ncbi:MAG: AbrB/MazE/SpoVT family DNA-binding domain-containing protein [Rhizobiaceae bacterium]